MEIWKKIKGFENYEISITGLIRKGNKIMKPYHNKKNDNHLKIKLAKDGKRYSFFVHQLVATNYIPNPDNLPEINHIDHNPENNSVTNLEWISHKNNCKDAAEFRKVRDSINQTTFDFVKPESIFINKQKTWKSNE